MFEVRCLVGDKSLHRLLHAVDGMTIESPVVLSVKSEDNGTMMPQTPARENKNGQDAIRAFIAENHLTEISPRQMREHLSSKGWSRNAYSHALNRLIEDGLLKKSKAKANTYEVIANG